ncbi:DUF3016 domain-containing protein [Kangiella sp. HZ709]|uniref:DUF3016 domain-containing protein n=1 Tax=Kangiella sp. HZ709 TaxID=2666328 RepID=UPI0012AF51DB|nr:DUF3016 domain-containing protein [Kangiella sp. HZ709]MRX28558.1 DUF3016 domain-containing protein [Kangiella sp. HZ709]
MKRFKVLVLSLLTIFPIQVFADSSVEWSNPENYTDVEAIDGSQKKFEKRVFKNLEKHFAKLSKRLPDSQKLYIKVEDLDLAGRVLPGNASGLNNFRENRIVKSIDYPKIKFTYRVTDVNEQTISSGNVELKDLAFQNKIRTRQIARDYLGYEKRLLTDWFKKKFSS